MPSHVDPSSINFPNQVYSLIPITCPCGINTDSSVYNKYKQIFGTKSAHLLVSDTNDKKESWRQLVLCHSYFYIFIQSI